MKNFIVLLLVFFISGCKKFPDQASLPPRSTIIKYCWQTFDLGLKDKSDFVKNSTILTLGRIGNRTAVETMQAIDFKGRPSVVRTYVYTLSQLHDTAAFQALHAYFYSNDFQIRETVVTGLARMSDLYDDSTMIRIFKRALAEADSIQADTLLYDKEEIARDKLSLKAKAGLALLKMNDRSGIEFIRAASTHPAFQVRVSVVQVIGEIRPAGAIGLLHNFINDPSDYVRSKTAEALGKLNTAEANHRLKSMINDRSADVRAKAAEKLLATDEDIALEILLKDFNTPDDGLKSSIMLTLGDVKDETARSKIIALLRDQMADSSEWIRIAAIGALGSLRDTTSIDLYTAALDDRSSSVREIAVGVLATLKGKAMLDDLMKFLKDDEYSMRSVAIAGLGKIEDEALVSSKIIPALYDRLRNDDDMMVRVRAAYTLLDLFNDRAFTKKDMSNRTLK